MTETETIRSTIQKRDQHGVVRHGAEWLTLWSDPGTMLTPAQLRVREDEARARAALRHHLAAAVRGVSGHPDLQLKFGKEGDETQPFWVSDADLDLANVSAIRGELDSRAVFLRFHNPAIHAANTPDEPNARRLFQLCEISRCDALGARMFRGIADNLVAAHLRRVTRMDLLGANLASLIPLAEALRMVLRDSLAGRATPSIESTGFFMWDRWLRERVQQEIDALGSCLDDQTDFALRALALIDAVFAALEGKGEGRIRRSPGSDKGDAGDENQGVDDADLDGAAADTDTFEPGDEMFGDDERRLFDALETLVRDTAPPYTAFTRDNDRIVRAESLVAAETLRTLRTRLDDRQAQYRRDFARLVSQLQRRLMARQNRSWLFDLEEGLIDASRLDRVIVNPGFSDAYKQEQESRFRDTVVTLLIDNSGSMRGKPIEIAAIVSDMLALALERCNVATEILGFTTSAFKGGKSFIDWARAGKPANPGRLNDLLHIIYKSADEPLRTARTRICAMLADGVLKENIDGEALIWASRRLMTRGESRKILIVISDGAPVDEATLEANEDKAILERHLHQAIAEIRQVGAIEIGAIGVRHDVSDAYPAQSRIENVEELGAALIAMIDNLIV